MLNIFTDLIPFNAATLSGCIDIIVVRQPDGSLVSSPFHVRFGKLKVLNSSDKHVQIHLNGFETDLAMKLGSAGEAFFVHQTTEELLDREDLRTSPIMSPGERSPRNSSTLKLKPDEVLSVVNDLEEMTKKLEHQEDQQLLEDERQLDIDDEKVDLKILQQSPEAIQRTISAQFKQEVEDQLHQVIKDQFSKDPKAAAEAQKKSQQSIWRWFWGDLPEKNMKLEIETEKPLSALTEDSSHKKPRSRSMSPIRNEEPIAKEEEQKESLMFPSIDIEMIKPEEEKTEKPKLKILDPLTSVDQTAIDKKGFLKTVFGYFRKGNGAQGNNQLIKQDSQEDYSNSNAFNGGQSNFGSTDVFLPNQQVGTPRGEEEDEASEIDISLCGHLISDQSITGGEQILKAFEDNRVSYESFCQNPHELLGNPNLVIRIEDQYYDWKTAAPFIISMLAFKQPISNEVIGQPLVVVEQLHRRAAASANVEEESSQFEKVIEESKVSTTSLKNDAQGSDTLIVKNVSSHSSSGESSPQAGSAKKSAQTKICYTKSLTPTLEQLEQLNLRPGANDVSFTVESKFQGRQTLQGRIFMWNYNKRIIISDVDGTITKSDMLGHVLPRLGKDWSHQGVAKLFTYIAKNEYEFLYLTSRPIGQADMTRDYIKGILQDQNFKMPDGPLIMSPDRLIRSFKREVIHRQPQMFKIAALMNIRGLFPDEFNPFHGGFGNRDTDAISYRAVGINLSRIFIINPDGEVHHFNSAYKKSYPLLTELVHEMFPVSSVLLPSKEQEELSSADRTEEVKKEDVVQAFDESPSKTVVGATTPPKPVMHTGEQQKQKTIELDDEQPLDIEDEDEQDEDIKKPTSIQEAEEDRIVLVSQDITQAK